MGSPIGAGAAGMGRGASAAPEEAEVEVVAAAVTMESQLPAVLVSRGGGIGGALHTLLIPLLACATPQTLIEDALVSTRASATTCPLTAILSC